MQLVVAEPLLLGGQYLAAAAEAVTALAQGLALKGVSWDDSIERFVVHYVPGRRNISGPLGHASGTYIWDLHWLVASYSGYFALRSLAGLERCQLKKERKAFASRLRVNPRFVGLQRSRDSLRLAFLAQVAVHHNAAAIEALGRELMRAPASRRTPSDDIAACLADHVLLSPRGSMYYRAIQRKNYVRGAIT